MTSGWQAVIKDPSSLSGSAFSDVVSVLARKANSRFVTCRDVEGAGDTISQLSTGIVVMTIDELLAVALGIVQFDWGDFFLCKTKAAAESISQQDSYATAIVKADVTVRCVDDAFFYVYGTDPQLLSSVRSVFLPAETKQGELGELDYPE